MFENILQSKGDEGFSSSKTEPNLDSERMEAGYNSLFEQGGQEGIDKFWDVRNERTELGYSPTSEGLKSALHQEETDMINLGVKQAIIDPNVDLDIRQQLATSPITDDRPESSLAVKLGRELLMEDDDTADAPATDEQDEVRSTFIQSLENVVKYREAQQSVRDGANFSDNANGLSIAADLAQMMVPFVEQANVAEALAKVGRGEESIGAFFALGEFKQGFFDSFKSMNLDERLAVVDQFVAVAKEANTTAFMTNGLLEQQMVDELLYGGNYSTADKWVDNVVSWFDLSILGKPVAWAVRGAQKVSKVGKVVNASAQVAETNRLAKQLLSDMKIDMIRTKVSPVSPIRMASETNAERTKAMFHAVVSDSTEEAAGAFGGASKLEVVADAVLPEMRKNSIVAELLGEAGEKLSRGAQKSLRAERHAAVSKLANIEKADAVVLGGKGTPARTAKRDAVARVSAQEASERQQLQDTIAHIDAQLSASNVGARAEADLSRLEQGIVPKRFAQEVEEVAEVVAPLASSQRVVGTLAQTTVSGLRKPGLPKFHQPNAVRAKVHNIDANIDKAVDSQVIKTALDESMVNALTRAEMSSATANEVNQLQDVVGVVSRTEMFQHSITPTGAKIHGVYGTAKTGWANPAEAIEQTELALRGHGVVKGDLYLMERSKDTGEYVRVDKPIGEDFLVGMDFDYKVNFSDVLQWDNLSVKRNFLDRIPLLAAGSINRNFFDPASILDPHIILGANAKVDKSAKITQDFLEIGKAFSESFGKADKESQASMYKYMLEANEQQIPHNINNLRGEYGFTATEIKTISNFREYWDTVWTARNVTDVKALRNRGFGIYSNSKGDNLFSRPIGKAQVSRSEKTYDPASGVSEYLTEEKLQKLYDSGHTLGKMRRPQQIGGSVTDQMIIRNDSNWRALNDTDKVYPYREGYFQRMYKAPVFITKRGITEGGVEFERAIATADTTVDADLYIKRLQAGDAEGVYTKRTDIKDPRAQGEFEIDTFESSGMSNQRERGNKLIDATAQIRDTEDANVLSPVDAIIASSRSMGRKVAMGDYIEATKQRFMSQFKDQLTVKQGQIQYPTSIRDIGAKGATHSKAAGDARSTYEYISFLEYGYINGMDSVYKSVMKSLAENAGGAGLRRAEVVLGKASEFAPTSLAKNLSFQMYLASNPIRQAALNAHQSTLLTAKFGKYVVSQRLAADMHAFMYMRMNIKIPKVAVKLTGRSESELKFMWKEYQKSGLSASIDQQNMVRGALTDMAEAQRFKGEQGLITGGLSLSRRAGFDLGEEVNLNSSWLAHYDEAVTSKKFLDASDLDRVSGNARNFTFNMNRAGDMPYNANSLSLFFQYMQVPHKSLLQMTNRSLTPVERTKLAMYNAIMFTLPPAAMYDMFGGILPNQEQHPEAHEAIVSGLQFYTFNKLIELSTGQDVSMDFGNLAPSDAYGLYDFMRASMTTELGQILAATPSGQLFAGSNPRITKFFKTLVSYIKQADTDSMSPTTLSNVFTDLAGLSSGMSNVFKAKMALEYHKAYGTRGQVTDPSVSTPEAMLFLFGFRTMEQTQRTWVGMDLYEKTKKYSDDVNLWYKTLTMKLASEGGKADTDEYIVTVLSMSFSAFGASEKAMGIIKRNLDRDSLAGSGVIYDSILKRADYVSGEQMEEWSNAVPDDGSGIKSDLTDTLKFMRDYKEQK